MARCKLNFKYFALGLICLVTFSVYYLLLRIDSIWPRPKLPEPEHALCVLVPFRNVHEELYEFIPHMNAFLHRQSIRFHFMVINQVPDKHRFNRGALFNAGFEFMTKEHPDCDYIALHDVDLLPLNDEISYGYPGDDVFHVAIRSLKYFSAGIGKDIGGIAIISCEQFIRCNGFSNQFWGWGQEDKNFLFRMKHNNIKRTWPTNLTTDWRNTFKNIHSEARQRDKERCGNQKMTTSHFAKHDFENGLKNLKYELTSVHSLTIDGIPFSFYSIKVSCDYSKTPWCKDDCVDKKKDPKKRN